MARGAGALEFNGHFRIEGEFAVEPMASRSICLELTAKNKQYLSDCDMFPTSDPFIKVR